MFIAIDHRTGERDEYCPASTCSLLGAIASVAGIASSINSFANAGSAGNQLAGASNQAGGVASQLLDWLKGNNAGFVSGGNQANNALLQLMGLSTGSSPTGLPNLTGTIDTTAPLSQPFTASTFQNSPGYGFAKEQGISAIQNSAAAKGGLNSGNTLRALQTFGTGLENQDYYNAANLYQSQQQQLYNMLSGERNAGQNALSTIAGVTPALSSQIGQGITGAANANVAGQIGQGNALTSGLGSLASLLNTPGIASLFQSSGAANPFNPGGSTTNAGLQGQFPGFDFSQAG